jgi:hypothetical protein
MLYNKNTGDDIVRLPNMSDYISLTTKEYVKEGVKLDILPPSEIIIKEKNDDYIIIGSSMGITEISDKGTISLMNAPKEIKIKKGETKKLTLPMTDYFDSVTITY